MLVFTHVLDFLKNEKTEILCYIPVTLNTCNNFSILGQPRCTFPYPWHGKTFDLTRDSSVLSQLMINGDGMTGSFFGAFECYQIKDRIIIVR